MKPKYELHATTTDSKGVSTTRRIYGTRDKGRFGQVCATVQNSKANRSALRPPSKGNAKPVLVLWSDPKAIGADRIPRAIPDGKRVASVTELSKLLGLAPLSLAQLMSKTRDILKAEPATFTVRGVTFRFDTEVHDV